MRPLPRIMIAPNGARRTKADHPALPVTIAETVETAVSCYEAGATGLHAHVRDGQGEHVLDAGLYRELLAEVRRAAPAMYTQITTEAVGRYSPEEQRALVRHVEPEAVSIAIREMVPNEDVADAGRFYTWCLEADIAVQHILYSDDDLQRLFQLLAAGVIPGEKHQALFVLGRYSKNQESEPADLRCFLEKLHAGPDGLAVDWAVCAFGHKETECLVHAIRKRGKARIGFENGLWNRDGTLARDNAERVRDLMTALADGSDD